MKTREQWNDEALNFKGYTYEEILATCQDIEKDIIDWHEEGLFEERNAEEYAKRLYEALEYITEHGWFE